MARRLLLVLGVCLAVVVLAAVTVRVWLETPGGQRWAARALARRVNAAIPGELRVERLDVDGLVSAEARGVTLHSPGGALVASADRVEVRLPLTSLLGDPLVIERLEVDALQLEVAPEAGGDRVALAAALEPVGGRPSTGGGGDGVAIRDLRVGISRVDVRPSAGAPPSWSLRDGEARGAVEAGPRGLTLDVSVDAQLARPVEGPARVELSASLDDGRVDVERLRGTLPGGIDVRARSAAREAGEGGGLDLGTLEVRLTLPLDALVRYGGPRLLGPVAVVGDVSQEAGGQIAFDVRADPPGPGEVLARGTITPAGPRFSAVLDVRGVDPARIYEGAPPGRLWAALDAEGTPAHATGTLWLAPSWLRGARLGPGRARLALDGERLAAHDLALALPGAKLSGRLALGGDRPPTVDVAVDVRRLQALAPVARALGADVPALEGALRARVAASGAEAARRLRVEARSGAVVVSGRSFRDLAITAHLGPERAVLNARAHTEEGRVAVSARANRVAPTSFRVEDLSLALGDATWRLVGPARIAWTPRRVIVAGLVLDGAAEVALDASVPRPGAPGAAPVFVDLRVEGLALARWERFVPDLVRPGTLSGRLGLHGTARRPELDGEVRLDVRNERGERVETRLELEARRARALARGEVTFGPLAPATVAVELRAPRGRALWEPGALLSSQLDAALAVPELHLARVADLLGLPFRLAGTVSGTFHGSGEVATATVAGELRVSGLVIEHGNLASLPPVSGSVRIDGDAERVRARLAARLDGAPELHADAELRRAPSELLERGAAEAPFVAAVALAPGPVDLPALGVAADSLALDAALRGTLGALRGEVQARAAGLAVREAGVGDVTLAAELAEGLATARLEVRGGGDAGTLSARFRLPAEGPWTAEVDARDARLSLLEALPQVGELRDAVASGKLSLRGPPEPSFEGRLTVRAAGVHMAGVAALQDVELRIAGEERSLVLEHLAASLRGGRAVARGRVRWHDDGAAGELHVSSERFPVPLGPRPVGEITTDVDARFALAGTELTGAVRVAPGEARLPDGLSGDLHPVSLPSDVLVHRGGDAAEDDGPSALSAFLDRLRARVTVEAPGDFWIRSEAANLEVAADLVARWNGERLVFEGEVTVPRGTLNVVRRAFEVERLELTFRGDPDVDPALDGRLAFGQGAVDVWIDLAGTLREPELEVTSDPTMDAAEIARVVAGGDGGLGAKGGLSGAVLSGALSFVAGSVGEALAANLPLDVLSFKVGPGGEVQRFEAGTYLTPRLFVSVVRRLLAGPDENTHEVQAEYELGRRLNLSTRYGDRQSGGVDLLYERRFESPAQQASGEETRPDVRAAGVGSGRPR